MNPRPFAWIAGALLLVLGICGFIPPLAPVETDPLRVASGVGGPQLFTLFPVSPVLSGIHVALGAWGLFAGYRLGRAVWFSRRAAFIFIALTVMGFIPGSDTMFGIAPLYGNNLLLHGLLAILSILFGWLYRRPVALPGAYDDEDEDD